MHNVSLIDENTTKNKDFQVKDKAIIFDALDDQGLELPHGCLAGSCGACRIEVITGADNLAEPSPIEMDTIKAIKVNHERIHGPGSSENLQVRLACRARVLGDVEIKSFN